MVGMALAWALCQGGQGHGSGVTPWPALHSLSASGRLTVGRGVGKMSRRWLTGGVCWQRLQRREEGVRVNSVRLTRGPKWQRQLAGLGARAAVVAWACVRALG